MADDFAFGATVVVEKPTEDQTQIHPDGPNCAVGAGACHTCPRCKRHLYQCDICGASIATQRGYSFIDGPSGDGLADDHLHQCQSCRENGDIDPAAVVAPTEPVDNDTYCCDHCGSEHRNGVHHETPDENDSYTGYEECQWCDNTSDSSDMIRCNNDDCDGWTCLTCRRTMPHLHTYWKCDNCGNTYSEEWEAAACYTWRCDICREWYCDQESAQTCVEGHDA